jgi:hypothetical protein
MWDTLEIISRITYQTTTKLLSRARASINDFDGTIITATCNKVLHKKDRSILPSIKEKEKMGPLTKKWVREMQRTRRKPTPQQRTNGD